MLQIYMANLLALCIPLIPTGSLAGLGVLESRPLFVCLFSGGLI